MLITTKTYIRKGIDKDKFYAKYSFYKLLSETNYSKKYNVRDVLKLKQALRRFSGIDSKRLLHFARKIFTCDIDLDELFSSEKRMLGMLHYTIWGKKPEVSYSESLSDLKKYNIDIINELLEIIEYNLSNIKLIEIEYEDRTVPLDIYASYNIQQIMVAFAKTSENYEYPLRERVIYIEEKNTDIFFITINKIEEDYLPSTMYNDYAKNSELFNWESQSTTGVDTITGQRYINDRTHEHKILLFVRESKREYNVTAPYIFLGNARYVSHKGSKPIQIVWKMDHSIPERIIRESNLKVVN